MKQQYPSRYILGNKERIHSSGNVFSKLVNNISCMIIPAYCFEIFLGWWLRKENQGKV